MPMDRNPLAEGYEARSKNVKNYAGLRHPGVLNIRFHSLSDGEVIG